MTINLFLHITTMHILGQGSKPPVLKWSLACFQLYQHTLMPDMDHWWLLHKLTWCKNKFHIQNYVNRDNILMKNYFLEADSKDSYFINSPNLLFLMRIQRFGRQKNRRVFLTLQHGEIKPQDMRCTLFYFSAF